MVFARSVLHWLRHPVHSLYENWLSVAGANQSYDTVREDLAKNTRLLDNIYVDRCLWRCSECAPSVNESVLPARRRLVEDMVIDNRCAILQEYLKYSSSFTTGRYGGKVDPKHSWGLALDERDGRVSMKKLRFGHTDGPNFVFVQTSVGEVVDWQFYTNYDYVAWNERSRNYFLQHTFAISDSTFATAANNSIDPTELTQLAMECGARQAAVIYHALSTFERFSDLRGNTRIFIKVMPASEGDEEEATRTPSVAAFIIEALAHLIITLQQKYLRFQLVGIHTSTEYWDSLLNALDEAHTFPPVLGFYMPAAARQGQAR